MGEREDAMLARGGPTARRDDVHECNPDWAEIARLGRESSHDQCIELHQYANWM